MGYRMALQSMAYSSRLCQVRLCIGLSSGHRKLDPINCLCSVLKDKKTVEDDEGAHDAPATALAHQACCRPIGQAADPYFDAASVAYRHNGLWHGL